MASKKKLKSRKPTTFCSEFPLDLLAQVLGRLPVKTLLQFRCVCKEWRSLIDSSSFASLHFTLYNNTRKNAPLFLIEQFGSRRRERCTLRHCDTFRKVGQVDFFRDYNLVSLSPMDYANGFVLCAKLYDNYAVLSFVVWNPSTRRSTKIPYPSSLERCFLYDMKAVLVGPLAGSPNDHYKVVLIPNNPWEQSSIVLIQVYSFSTRSWSATSIDRENVYQGLYDYHRLLVPLNGVVHWISDKSNCIVAFDVQDHAVRYLRLPGNDIRGGILSILHQSLVLLDFKGKDCNIWVMERYGVDESWVLRHKIVTNYNCDFLCLRRNGELFFTIMERKGVKAYNIESRQTEVLAKSYDNYTLFMETFVESLVSLPRSFKEPKMSLL